MNKTIVIYGSSTGTCQSIAEKIASKLKVEAIDVQTLDAGVVDSYDNLIIGTSTWGAGELQDDWYDGLKLLQGANLSGKTIAIFGCGDCESYGDTFVSAMGELYNGLKAAVPPSSGVCPPPATIFQTARRWSTASLWALPSTTSTKKTRPTSALTHG